MTFANPVATSAEIEAVFSPYVSEEISTSSSRYQEQLAHQAAKLAKRSRSLDSSLEPAGWRDGQGNRTVAQVDSGYERAWSSVSLTAQVNSPKSTWFEWGEKAMVARTIGRKHLHQLLFVRALEQLTPRSVAEIGFGNGFNLLLMAMQFPDIELSGVELTNAGVQSARTLSTDPETASVLSPFAIKPVRQGPLLTTERLLQGRGDALPLDAKSVDLAFTSLALEQMEHIRTAALRELARIARRYVMMIEPFRDWNSAGVRRSYIEHHHYFDAALADLEAVGLRPVLATADFPNKINFHVGLVIAEVM